MKQMPKSETAKRCPRGRMRCKMSAATRIRASHGSSCPSCQCHNGVATFAATSCYCLQEVLRVCPAARSAMRGEGGRVPCFRRECAARFIPPARVETPFYGSRSTALRLASCELYARMRRLPV